MRQNGWRRLWLLYGQYWAWLPWRSKRTARRVHAMFRARSTEP
jgi:hypothetical protein